MMRLARADLIVVSTCCSVILGSSLWLWADFTSRISAGEAEQIGTVTFRRKSAMRKYGGQVIWEEIGQNSPVYGLDSLKTESDSSALIRLAGGMEIELEENSLIVLDWNEKETKIDFERGAIRTHGAGAPGDVLVIQLSNSRLTARGADLNIRQNPDAAIAVTLDAGSARVTSGDSSAVLSTNQAARINRRGGEVAVIPRPVRHLAPAGGSRLLSSGGPIRTAFRWQNEGSLEMAGFLDLDNSPNFAAARTVPASAAGMVELAPGTWYWRVRTGDTASQPSQPSRLEVLVDPEARILSPASGTVYRYRSGLPAIPLRWRTGPLAASARLQFSRNAGFSPVTLEYTPAGDELTVDLPEDGTWYWRVIPVYGFGDTGMTGASRPASFNIERLAALVAPVPQAPADKRTVTTLEIARRGLVFSFHAEGGLRRGNIEIADNASFTGMTRRLEATGGFATLRDPLPPGIWYWRAEGLDSDGSRSPVSSIRSLRIVDLGAAGLKPVTPAHQAELEGESVGFQWDGPDMLGTYRWRMAADEAFQEKLLEENLTGRSLRREKLAPGRWFWQVFLVSEDGQELSTGPVRSFLLRSRLAAPRLLAPTEGMVVDMRRANTLLFSWEEVPGTDRYRLRLLDANGRIIASGMLAKPPWSFTELEKLDVGRFRWEVQAFPAGNNRLPGPVAAAVFTISLGPPPEAPQLLSPEVQYVD